MRDIDYINSDFKLEDLAGESSVPALISIIIPVYNAERYLIECLNSIIHQTYRNLEIICINDGSTDHSLELLKMFSKKDSRIKIINKKNGGPSSARNVGLEIAKGDYVSFVDADDYLQTNAYEILVECAMQKQKWDLIIFGGNIIGEANEFFSYKLDAVYHQYMNCDPGEVVFYEKSARPFLWLHFIKRELLEKPVKIRFDENLDLGEDQIFQFEYIPRAKNVMVIDPKLYNYRIEQNSSLMQFYNYQKVKKTECHFQIIEKVIKNWKKNGLYDAYAHDLWTWAVQLVYWTIVDFPVEFKKSYSDRVIALMEENGAEEFLLANCEVQHYRAFKLWALDERNSQEEIDNIIKKINSEKYEITETLKSRAFKLGRFLTTSQKRLNI